MGVINRNSVNSVRTDYFRKLGRMLRLALPIPELPGWESRPLLLRYPPEIPTPVHSSTVTAIGYVLRE